MENNTAQGGTIQYPNVSSQTAQQPISANQGTQSSQIYSSSTGNYNSSTDNSVVDNLGVDVGGSVQQQTPEQQNFAQSSVPPEPSNEEINNSDSGINFINGLENDNYLKGVANNQLQDIIPGEKVPRALKRTPKELNVAQPIFVKEEPEPSPLDKINEPKEIDELLHYAVVHNASDLHISVGYPPIVRIDGELMEISDKVITAEEAEDLIFSILSDEKRELLEVNREIDLAYFYEGEIPARFRVNAFYTKKNLSAAFRIIPSRIRTLEELFLPKIFHQFAQLKQGFILITGPTGHGKSTSLAAILEEINMTRFAHILTIEDPIEYIFEGKKSLIDQREMNDDTHSWSIALRSALRQDPDVILVGEMRDYETIAAAVTLAETGHLVFATLHTNSAAQTIDRMIDVFPHNQQQQIRMQLSNIVEAVVAQRLIPLDKGGRRSVCEIMIANPAIRNMIRESKTHQIDNVIRTSSDIGMVSLERSLVNLVREGVISVQKAQEYAVYPEEVLRLLKS